MKTDFLLEQGSEYLMYNKRYNDLFFNAPHYLQNTNSYREGLENNNSINQKSKQIVNDKNTALQQKFNKILSEYSATYKSFSEDLLGQNRDIIKARNYKNKIITNDDGNYYYVNNFGITHKYSAGSWDNKDFTCPSDPIKVSPLTMNMLRDGPSMNNNTPCQVAGKNVQNEKTKEFAWVDIKGYKHIYSDAIWKNKNKSCQVDAVILSDIQYEAIPEGPPMTRVKICNKFNINPKIWHKLNKLNDKLLALSEQLIDEIEESSEDDVKLQQKLIDKKNLIKQQIKTFKEDKQYLNKSNITDVYGMEEESENYMNITYVRYTLWIILSCIVVLFTVKTMAAEDNEPVSFIVLLFLLLVLFVLVKQFFRY